LLVAAAAGLYAIIVFKQPGSNAPDGPWSGIDVQLKRRSELVPNLVETLKGYAGHERSVMEDVPRSAEVEQRRLVRRQL
jgi:LemA protein